MITGISQFSVFGSLVDGLLGRQGLEKFMFPGLPLLSCFLQRGPAGLL